MLHGFELLISKKMSTCELSLSYTPKQVKTCLGTREAHQLLNPLYLVEMTKSLLKRGLCAVNPL